MSNYSLDKFNLALNALQRAASEITIPSPEGTLKSIDVLRDIEAVTKLRRDLLPTAWRESPAWDIIVEVCSAEYSGRPCYVKHACLASGVPSATASRHLALLIREGWLQKGAGGSDRRLVHLSPSAQTTEIMVVWLGHRKQGLLRLFQSFDKLSH